jgi:ADP-dependent NAD(P)H-hydrate dehydratase / NAD(P)H-hydrate epimerase
MHIDLAGKLLSNSAMKFSARHFLFNPAAMTAVDKDAADSGLWSYALMERAGQAISALVLRHYPAAHRYIVLCGPGNNGGDGYVAAQALAASGATPLVYHLGDQDRLRGDAQRAMLASSVKSEPLESYRPQAGDVVIDALFGAGLSRDVPDSVVALFDDINALGLDIVAADLPSGVCGRRGTVLGAALKARHSVTFMALKPGHLLMPGRELAGETHVFDIGIPQRILERHSEPLAQNDPVFWQDHLAHPGASSHKFTRGHLTVFSGPQYATGAARLSAGAGLKSGAGLVTVAAPSDAMPVLAATLTAVMLTPIDTVQHLKDWLTDSRHAGFVIGPGFSDLQKIRQFVPLLADKALVLDADAITAFRDEPALLFDVFARHEAPRVMTPHGGEFARLFPDIAADEHLSKVEKAQAASARSHTVVIYKGADTVIAAPDGRAIINANAPPNLATAGSGDVLSGIVGGLLAQGVPAFEAAAAAVWLHGEAGQRAGHGSTAEDILAAVKPYL